MIIIYFLNMLLLFANKYDFHYIMDMTLALYGTLEANALISDLNLPSELTLDMHKVI
jgi:hypothetical protein